MTYDEFLEQERNRAPRKKPDDEEHRIQCACVKWFRVVYPQFKSVSYTHLTLPTNSRV